MPSYRNEGDFCRPVPSPTALRALFALVVCRLGRELRPSLALGRQDHDRHQTLGDGFRPPLPGTGLPRAQV